MATDKPRREEAWNRSFLHSHQKKPPLPTPWLSTSSLQHWENIENTFLLFSPVSCGYSVTEPWQMNTSVFLAKSSNISVSVASSIALGGRWALKLLLSPIVNDQGWRKWQPTPIFLPRISHGQRSLAGYSPWGRKESDTTEQLTLSLSKIDTDSHQFFWDVNMHHLLRKAFPLVYRSVDYRQADIIFDNPVWSF